MALLAGTTLMANVVQSWQGIGGSEAILSGDDQHADGLDPDNIHKGGDVKMHEYVPCTAKFRNMLGTVGVKSSNGRNISSRMNGVNADDDDDDGDGFDLSSNGSNDRIYLYSYNRNDHVYLSAYSSMDLFRHQTGYMEALDGESMLVHRVRLKQCRSFQMRICKRGWEIPGFLGGNWINGCSPLIKNVRHGKSYEIRDDWTEGRIHKIHTQKEWEAEHSFLERVQSAAGLRQKTRRVDA